MLTPPDSMRVAHRHPPPQSRRRDVLHLAASVARHSRGSFLFRRRQSCGPVRGRRPGSNAKPTWKSRGLRLGNYVQVREAIELELENIYNSKKTVNEGLNAAVLRGNAILREFSVSHGAAPQGEI